MTQDGSKAIARRFLEVLLDQMGAAPGVEPVLDADEIQGNIAPGFSKDHQTLVVLEIVDPAQARRWLARLIPHVATLREVHDFKRLFERTRRRRGAEGAVMSTWINVALAAGGLARLGADPGAVTDRAFRDGMARRAAVLGDPVDPRAPGHATRWRFGSEPVADILLIVAGDDGERVERETARWVGEAPPGLRVIFAQRGAVLPPPLTDREPFGYADGISQPRLRGRLSSRDDDFLEPRAADGRLARPQPGGPIWPGEFILGYPREGIAGAAGAASDGGPAWMRNGSFVVVRRLRQDVPRFHAFLRDASARLARDVPALRDLTPARLGALMFGRWASGAPLELAPDRDAPQLGKDRTRNNEFSFSRGALPCPHAAHIRRSNPRNDRDDADHHRLLRRGIPFADGAERGLLFVAYIASIERQFERVTRAWLNAPDLGVTGAGVDPIVGAAATGRTFTVPVSPTGAGPILTLPEWVTPTGGEYFFAPSISALAQLTAR
jgi:Dyp-type peroxidase family